MESLGKFSLRSRTDSQGRGPPASGFHRNGSHTRCSLQAPSLLVPHVQCRTAPTALPGLHWLYAVLSLPLHPHWSLIYRRSPTGSMSSGHVCCNSGMWDPQAPVCWYLTPQSSTGMAPLTEMDTVTSLWSECRWDPPTVFVQLGTH